MRSHLSSFKKYRAARIDHYVVEVNKLLIRLEKVICYYLIFQPFKCFLNIKSYFSAKGAHLCSSAIGKRFFTCYFVLPFYPCVVRLVILCTMGMISVSVQYFQAQDATSHVPCTFFIFYFIWLLLNAFVMIVPAICSVKSPNDSQLAFSLRHNNVG